HCPNCNHFYPTSWHGCIRCNPGHFSGPYCEHCGVVQKGIVEVDPQGIALRPMCPTCKKGPMAPSAQELLRREKGTSAKVESKWEDPIWTRDVPLQKGEVSLCDLRAAMTDKG